ncbi:hypothetical protein BDZ89DRAFT_499560 [Hymenopellis radicata]|nr:hypothetical protein BDZ89DRAFT_499560 [Hymenopellis radicata]
MPAFLVVLRQGHEVEKTGDKGRRRGNEGHTTSNEIPSLAGQTEQSLRSQQLTMANEAVKVAAGSSMPEADDTAEERSLKRVKTVYNNDLQPPLDPKPSRRTVVSDNDLLPNGLRGPLSQMLQTTITNPHPTSLLVCWSNDDIGCRVVPMTLMPIRRMLLLHPFLVFLFPPISRRPLKTRY